MGIARATAGRSITAAAALLLVAGCGRSPSPAPVPPPATGSPSPETPSNTATVTGRERLAWSQDGNTDTLRFVAIVNGTAVDLPLAACRPGAGAAECSSPLPPLADGLHTIGVAAVLVASGLTGPMSEPITVRKVSSAAGVAARLAAVLAAAGTAAATAPALAPPIFPEFSARVVVEGLRAPLQLAAAADGRLFAADGDARIVVLTPDASATVTLALDVRAALDRPSSGPAGIALHPQFAENHLVYVAFVSAATAGGRLHIVRLREAGGVLGEAATLFEAPVTAEPGPASLDRTSADTAPDSRWMQPPRLVFGRDGLLYALMPAGLLIDDPMAASRPHPSVLRLDDAGRLPGGGHPTGIESHPLTLAWHPVTAAAWAVFARPDGSALARAVSSPVDGPAGGAEGVARLRLLGGAPELAASPELAVRLDTGPEVLSLASAFLGAHSSGTGAGAIRFALPIAVEPAVAGAAVELLDLTAAGDGTWLAAVRRAAPIGAGPDGAILSVRFNQR